MIAGGLVGLLGMFVVGAWPTRSERARWRRDRAERRALEQHERFVHAAAPRPFRPGTAR